MGFLLHSSKPCVLGSGWKWELNLPPGLAHFYLLQSWENFPLPPFGFLPRALCPASSRTEFLWLLSGYNQKPQVDGPGGGNLGAQVEGSQ